MTNENRVLDITPRGWAALGRGDWEGARAHFSAALEHDESPDALEGLGWAGWWLDDAATVFDARERAYRLYRQRGDRQLGSAELALDQGDVTAAADGIHDLARQHFEDAVDLFERSGTGV